MQQHVMLDSDRTLSLDYDCHIVVALLLQIYAWIVQKRGDSRLPEKFGNFPPT